jgi:hypothetical protein
MGRLSAIVMRPLTAAERQRRLRARLIGMRPLTAAERQRRLRATLEATTALGLMATAAPYLNERDASGFLGMSSDGVGHQDSERPTWDNEHSHESAELIRSKGDGPAEPTLLFGHNGTVGEDMEAMFGQGRMNTSRDRLPMRTVVRHISLNVHSPIDWLCRMRDLRVRLPTSFRAFPRFHRRSESARSYSELIAQREMPKSARSTMVATPMRRAGHTLALSALGITTFAIVFLVGLYVTLDPDSTAEQPTAVVVTASRLNCRAEPSLRSKVLHVAKLDEKLDVLGEGVRWWRVRVQDSQCWISSEYAKSADGRRQQRMRGWVAVLSAQVGLGGLESSHGKRQQSE